MKTTSIVKHNLMRAAVVLLTIMLTTITAWAGNIADCELRGKMEGFEDGYGPYNSLTANVQVWYGDTQLEYNTDYDIEVEYVESYEVGQTYNATVIGMGDWSGSKGFIFTFVISHHNVIFVANGGTGTMADDIVGNDNPIYYLPECGFTAPEYKVFDHWEASCEEGVEKQPGDYFTAPYIYQPSDIQTITVTAYWAGLVQEGSTSETVTIPDGENLTLVNATITGGIVCEGSATITLVGTNIVNVNNVSSVYKTAGIQIGGSGTTLTTKGDGSLTATGGSAAAGIGLGRTWDASVTAGAIVIEGGTINASGDIGIGIGTVGNSQTASIDGISIKGGTVNASLGKGYLYNGSTATIGYIKIYDTIDMVDASKITETVTYMHGDDDVTANKTDYFTISENGDRRIIVPKDDTDYTITIADGIEHGTLSVAAATAKYMETVTINAMPDFGYHFVRLVVKDANNNDVASTNNTFLMPKSNVTVSAVFEQGTHGTTEFAWGYSGPSSYVTDATIYDGVTTVNIQNTGVSYSIRKYDEYTYYKFLLDNDTYDADIPYAGGTGEFYGTGNGTSFRITGNGETGYYDITLTDVGNGKWGVSILPTPAQMDVVPDQTYTGSAITPEPLVIAGSLSLTKGTDYVYSYTNNTNVGTATVRATFQGDYESLGYVEKTFTINYYAQLTVEGYGTGTGGWYLIASPLAGSILATEVPNLANANDNSGFDLYRFNQTADLEWENWKSHANNDDHYHFNLESGRGYLYANAEDVNLIFTGTPHDGDGQVTLSKDANARLGQWNLIGNPLGTNATLGTKPFYIMNEGGTEIIAADNDHSVIAPMQGVFVQANEDGEIVTFTPQARGADNEACIVLNLAQNGPLTGPSTGSGTVSGTSTIDRVIVRIGKGETLSKLQIRDGSTKVYIPQDGKNYAIISVSRDAARHVSTTTGVNELPVNFKAAENGTYTISANLEGVETDYLHLIDNLTGADVNLLQTHEYTFTARTTDYESRFRLVFSVSGDADGDNDAPFAYINNGNIIINGEGTLQVMDMLGQVVVCRDAARHVSTGEMPAGVYMLRLIDGDSVRTQKMVIE